MSDELIRIFYDTFGEASLARTACLSTNPEAKVEIHSPKLADNNDRKFELIIYPQESITEEIVKGRLLDQICGRLLDE